MQRPRTVTPFPIVALLALALPGCGVDPLLTGGGPWFPPPTCNDVDKGVYFSWQIEGLDRSQLVDPAAPADQLAIGIDVGQSVPLHVRGFSSFAIDCSDSIVSVDWASSPEGVVSFTPVDAAHVRMTGAAPGLTRIRAMVRFRTNATVEARASILDGTSHAVEPAIRVQEAR